MSIYQPAAAQPTRNKWSILAVASVAQFLAILDLFAVTVAIPQLRISFSGASAGSVSWVLNAYTIVMAALLIPAGRLADSTSRKRGFLVGMTLFGVSSVLCALAPTLPLLIAARVVQAVAAALLVPTGLGLVLPSFEPREHPTVMGIWTAIASAGASCGPVFGGLLLQLGWRWIFWLNVPFTILAVLIGLRILPDVRIADGRRLDLLGAALILTATAALTTTFVQTEQWGYASIATGGTLLLAIAATAALWYHLRHHPDPILSPEVLRHRMFRVAASGVFCYYLAFAALILAGTLFMTQRWGFSELEASLGIAPVPVSCLVTAPFSGRIVRRIGARASVALGGLAIAGGALWWISWAATDSYLIAFLPGAVIAGVSTSLLQPPLFTASNLLPPSQLSLGAGTLMMARQTSSALGVAVLTAILAAHASPTLLDYRMGWAFMVVTGLLAAAAGWRFRAMSVAPATSPSVVALAPNLAAPAAGQHCRA